MKFAKTTRNTYTKKRVREMAFNRRLMKPKKEGVPQHVYENILGELQAAGHLAINGFINQTTDISDDGRTKAKLVSKTIQFNSYVQDGLGERPHLTGYLESASNADKQTYRIKGWFNDDGTIRIELVK